MAVLGWVKNHIVDLPNFTLALGTPRNTSAHSLIRPWACHSSSSMVTTGLLEIRRLWVMRKCPFAWQLLCFYSSMGFTFVLLPSSNHEKKLLLDRLEH